MPDPTSDDAAHGEMHEITSAASALTLASHSPITLPASSSTFPAQDADQTGSSAERASSVCDFTNILYTSDRITRQEYDTFLALYRAEHPPLRMGATVGDKIVFKYCDATAYWATNKAAEVFNVSELLDIILQHLDFSKKGLLTDVQLACKGFKQAMESSAVLKNRTAFVILTGNPMARPGLLDNYRNRYRLLTTFYPSRLSPKWFAEEQVQDICRYLDSKFHLPVKALYWGLGLPMPSGLPTANSFVFKFKREGQSYSDRYPTHTSNRNVRGYRENPVLRNLRICDRAVQAAEVVFHSVQYTVRIPDEGDLTFGHLFDKIDKHLVGAGGT